MRRIVLKWIAPGVVTVLLGTAVTVLTNVANKEGTMIPAGSLEPRVARTATAPSDSHATDHLSQGKRARK